MLLAVSKNVLYQRSSICLTASAALHLLQRIASKEKTWDRVITVGRGASFGRAQVEK
jgi:fructoselysine-6-P-deglycase FrlB-like protein